MHFASLYSEAPFILGYSTEVLQKAGGAEDIVASVP